MTTQTLPRVRELSVTANKLVAKAKELIHEGNARRIIIKNADGVVLLEVPLTVGVVGGVLEPVWVALGALAALTAHYRIAIVPRAIERTPAPAAVPSDEAPAAMAEAPSCGLHFTSREDV